MVLITLPQFSEENARDGGDRYRVRVCEMRRRGKRSRDRAERLSLPSATAAAAIGRGNSQRQAVSLQGTLLFAASLEARGRYVVSKCRGDSKMPTFEGEKSRSQSLRRMRRAKIFSSVFDKQQMWLTDRQLWRSVLNFRRSWVQKSKHIHNFCFSPNLRRRCENAPERADGAVKHNFEGVEH